MNILLTGGAGFIGSHLVELFQDKADEIRVLDNLRTGNRNNLEGMRHSFIHGSVQDRDVVRSAMADIDYVFHLAAMVSVPESMRNPLDYCRTNSEGTIVVLEEAGRAGVKKLCLSTTSAIYGDDPELPKREDMRPCPRSPYAQTKLDGEFYCRTFTDEGWLDTVCLRYFNVFGPRQDPGSAYAAAVPIFIYKATRNEDIVIYGDGEQTRDFVYVADVARANAHMALSDQTGVFNVAYGQSTRIQALAEGIVTALGSKSRIIHEAERPGDVKHSSADIAKLLGAGWEPAYTMDEGLQRTVDHFRQSH